MREGLLHTLSKYCKIKLHGVTAEFQTADEAGKRSEIALHEEAGMLMQSANMHVVWGQRIRGNRENRLTMT